VTRDEAMESRFADPSWGMYPQIALVYAIGDCDMETGIRGRYTSRLLRKLAKRDEIRAVVLRVDSPGGDPLPSDLVACEMETVAEQKPMVVSQGSVAASGGYWISMTADRIYTSPFTVTGSIGVIAGWIWNDGLTDKTGFTSDFVKVGEHADLGFGVRLPFLGVMVPDRNLDAYERARMEHLMKTLYHDFMDRVSSTRGIERETVEEIAQGRVWSGRRSVENRLTDEIGGLEQAIGHARHLAGIKAKRKIRIIEYPSPGLFNFDELFRPSSPIGALLWGWGSRDDELPVSHREYELSVLRRISESPAQPLLLTPSEDLPPEEDE